MIRNVCTDRAEQSSADERREELHRVSSLLDRTPLRGCLSRFKLREKGGVETYVENAQQPKNDRKTASPICLIMLQSIIYVF